MSKNIQHLSPLKEDENSNIIQRLRGSVKKTFISKKTFKNKLDIKGLMHKKSLTSKKVNLSPVDLCLNSLTIVPKERDHESLQHIISYLKSLTNFMNIISKEKNMKLSEKIIEQISLHLQHRYIPKNNIVCRYGEKGDTFYIILKGKVIFLIPKPYKCYLTLEEYIIYLMQLRINNEYELINNLIIQNKSIYPIDDDHLDSYLIKEYEEYQKFQQHNKNTGIRNYNRSKTKIIPNRLINNRLLNFNNDRNYNENMGTIRNINLNININDKINEEDGKNKKNPKKYFSAKTYKKIEELIEIIRNPQLIFHEKPFLGEITPKRYMKLNNVVNTKLDPKGRKFVNIYVYEEMSIFENGQTFGFIALQNKNSKREATAIVIEDCDLGVLTKEEYVNFFELISNREKKNLYELLKGSNLITTISEYKFIKRYYHMFEYIKYYKSNTIIDINKQVDELIVFKSGIFKLNICVNIPELNELISQLKIVRGQLLGLSKYKIERQLEERRENQDIIMRKNYISSEENKMLSKKYNYTLSIINTHLILGYPDTVDPETHLPFFNCYCLSSECDGYLISNRAINFINEESIVIHNLKDYCLTKIEYNLNRLKQLKKEIFARHKSNEMISSPPKKQNKSLGINLSINKKERTLSENNVNKKDILLNNNVEEEDDDIFYFERNQAVKRKNNNNNKTLYSFKFHSNLIETLNNFNYNMKNEEIKNNKDKDKKKILNIQTNINTNLQRRNNINIKNNNNSYKNQSNNNVIQQLRDNIFRKQKNIELKREHYYKVIEDINKAKKEKLKKQKENSLSINMDTMKDIQKSFSNNQFENNNIEDRNNKEQISFAPGNYTPNKNFSITQNIIIKDKINNINSISHKVINPFQTNDNFILPSIIKKKKKSRLNNYIEKLQTDYGIIGNNKKDKLAKNNLYESYNELYNDKLYHSLVKNTFIIFKSPPRPYKKDLFTDTFQPKKNPVKLKKDNYKNSLNLNELTHNDIEENKKEYPNNDSNKQNQKNILENDIKEKYKELGFFLKNIQKTTNEILEKKKCL